MRAWIEAQSKRGRYGNASEYLRDLIRRDQERQAQEGLEDLLLDGAKRGPASYLTNRDWAELRADVAVYLAEVSGSDELAFRFLDATEASCDSLAPISEMGTARTDSNPALLDVRMWRAAGFPSHLVFHRPVESGIEVIRVIHAKRDIESLFGGGGRDV